MATVRINLCVTNARMQQQPVIDDVPVAGETITSSAASQATTISASQPPNQDAFWGVTSVGGAVWVKFAAVPVAAVGDTWLVPDGQTCWFRATPGYKAAVINA